MPHCDRVPKVLLSHLSFPGAARLEAAARSIAFLLAILAGTICCERARAECVDYGASPQLQGSVEAPGAFAIAVQGNHAYLAGYVQGDSSSLKIVDISDPSSPQIVGVVNTPGNARGVAVAGDYAYVAVGYDGFRVVDISDPTSPRIVGSTDTPWFAIGVALQGHYAYVADDGRGLQVIDISDPTAPHIVGSVDTTGWAYGVAVAGSYAYVADKESGLHVIDISNPSLPLIVGTEDTPGYAYGVCVAGAYAYVADWHEGLQVIDVSNPSAPERVGTCDTPVGARGVAISNCSVYVADETSGLQVIDVLDPTSPHVEGSLDLPGASWGIAVSGEFAYVAAYGSGMAIAPIQCDLCRGYYITFSGEYQGLFPTTETSRTEAATEQACDRLPIPSPGGCTCSGEPYVCYNACPACIEVTEEPICKRVSQEGYWSVTGNCGYPTVSGTWDVVYHGPDGACCDIAGACTITNEPQCSQGTWLGPGTICDPNPCPDLTGACCDLAGNCLLTFEVECGAPLGWFGGGSSCTPNPCPPNVDCPLGHEWSASFGDGAEQRHGIVTADSFGNVYFAGDFQGTVDFGGGTPPLTTWGDWDGFLAKFDTDGACLWSRHFGDPSPQESITACADTGGVVIFGDYEGTIDLGCGPHTSAGASDMYLARLDGNGVCLWSRSFGGTLQDLSSTCVVGRDGHILITGEFQGGVDFGCGPMSASGSYDIFLAEFDYGGTCLWSRRFGDHCLQYGQDVAFDPPGGIVLAGLFQGSIDFGCVQLATPGCETTGTYVAKFDSGGTCLWARSFSGDEAGVEVDASGDITYAGVFGRVNGSVDFDSCGSFVTSGDRDVFVSKLDGGDGHCLWSRTFGDAADQSIDYWQFNVDESGTSYLAGFFHGTIDFGCGQLSSSGGADIYVTALDPNGGCLWSQAFGTSAGDQRPAGTALVGSAIVLGGYFGGVLNLGGAYLVSAGGTDVYLARLPIQPCNSGTGSRAPRAREPLTLEVVGPSPVSSGVELILRSKAAGYADVSVFDSGGRFLRRLYSDNLPPGLRKVTWDGRDSTGDLLPSGLYFVCAKSPQGAVTRRLVVVR